MVFSQVNIRTREESRRTAKSTKTAAHCENLIDREPDNPNLETTSGIVEQRGSTERTPSLSTSVPLSLVYTNPFSVVARHERLFFSRSPRGCRPRLHSPLISSRPLRDHGSSLPFAQANAHSAHKWKTDWLIVVITDQPPLIRYPTPAHPTAPRGFPASLYGT